MELFLHLTLAIAVLILAAKIGGYISFRLGQPSVLGELIVGILVGPSLFDIIHVSYFAEIEISEIINVLAEIGVMLLMFIAGLELNIPDLIKSGKVSALAGVLGVVFPVLMGAGLGVAFGMPAEQAIFLGLVLSATSVSISAQTLMELNVIRSSVGLALLGAAVFDDILVILGLSVFTALTGPGREGGIQSLSRILIEMAIFLIIAIVFGWFFLPRLSRLINKLPISQGLIAFVFVITLLFGWLAEELGHMAPITGAFLAGLFLSRSPVKEKIEIGIPIIAYAIFAPIFFIDVGLSANIRLIWGEPLGLFLLLVVVAVISKIIGAGSGALLGKMSRLNALRLGVGMVSRGEVGLIVASVGLTQKLLNQTTFAAIVGVILVTTLITPVMLRTLYPSKLSLPAVET
jgi:Kef-type K+ transport system membrane component KefB